MNEPGHSWHATQRRRQRGISMLQLQLLREHGVYHYQRGGTYVAFIPQKAIRELRKALDKLNGVSAIIGEKEQTVTAMHKTGAIRSTEYLA